MNASGGLRAKARIRLAGSLALPFQAPDSESRATDALLLLFCQHALLVFSQLLHGGQQIATGFLEVRGNRLELHLRRLKIDLSPHGAIKFHDFRDEFIPELITEITCRPGNAAIEHLQDMVVFFSLLFGQAAEVRSFQRILLTGRHGFGIYQPPEGTECRLALFPARRGGP